eukprot:TRINITY_DN6600_c0_g1_i5.p1 TRINITY_DN6600_c0_g1~~TRINITY_DN6600_c0_g1_i5.p1  ORF type:complete len:437 (-),score=74.52 TRINITY_DN6600_c0_g1_i5:96-1406(-)
MYSSSSLHGQMSRPMFLIPLLMCVLFFSPTILSERNSSTDLVFVILTGSLLFFGEKQKILKLFIPLEILGNWSFSIYLYYFPAREILLPFFPPDHKMKRKELVFFCAFLSLLRISSYFSHNHVTYFCKTFLTTPRRTSMSLLFLVVCIFFLIKTVPTELHFNTMETRVETPKQMEILKETSLPYLQPTNLFDYLGWKKDDGQIWEFGDWGGGCVLVIGDEQAMMYLDVLRKFAIKHRLTLWEDVQPLYTDDGHWRFFFVRKNFPTFPEDFLDPSYCAPGRKMIFAGSVSGVHNLTDYNRSLDYLLTLGKGSVEGDGERACVVQVISAYSMPNHPIKCILNQPLKECKTEKINVPWELIPGLVPSKENFHLLDLGDLICPGGMRGDTCWYFRGVVPIYADERHLTKEFLNLITPLFMNKMESEFPCVQNVIRGTRTW